MGDIKKTFKTWKLGIEERMDLVQPEQGQLFNPKVKLRYYVLFLRANGVTLNKCRSIMKDTALKRLIYLQNEKLIIISC